MRAYGLDFPFQVSIRKNINRFVNGIAGEKTVQIEFRKHLIANMSRIRDSVAMSLEAFFLRYAGWLSWHTWLCIHGNSILNGQNGPNVQIRIQGNQLHLRQSHKCRAASVLCVCMWSDA